MSKPSLHKCLSFASGSLLLLLTACGNADTTPPAISDLSLTPAQATVGQQTTVTGSLVVNDADGDESEIDVDLTLPGGQKQALPPTMLQGAAGQTTGVIQFVLAFSPPTAGSYQVAVVCKDTEGNVSNTLTTTIEAK